ncbi:MAG: SPASM domain-containing protein [Armatimonadetes bacterium]|nr:SPASM domain-containing protein [Armatimonadota bacterium]
MMGANSLIGNLEWEKFYSLDGRPFYYFPRSMTIVEYDENFGRILTDLASGNGKPQGYPDGYVDEVLQNMEVLEKRGLLERLIPSPLPDTVPVGRIILANTMRCNLACTYCYNNFDFNLYSPEEKDMSMATFLRLVDFFERSGKETPSYELYFIGGEPLIKPEILEAGGKWGERLRKRGKSLSMAVTTNATLLRREIIDLCTRYKIGLKLTLDGDRDEHDCNRLFPDGTGSFERILKNLPDFFSRYDNPYKYVATTIDTLKSDLEGRIVRLTAMGFNVIDLTELYDAKGAKETDSEAKLTEMYRGKYRGAFEFLYLKARSRAYLRIIPLSDIVRNIHARKPSFSRCRAGIDSLAVSPEGAVYACHHFYGDKRFLLGMIEDSAIEGDKLAPYRVPVENRPECSSCWARLLCGGPCYHRSLAASGEAFGCNRMECIRRKAMIIEAMRFYIKLRNEDEDSLRWLVNSAPG